MTSDGAGADWWKIALVTVPVIVARRVGLSAGCRTAATAIRWFAALVKPSVHAAGLGVRRGLDDALRADGPGAGDDPRPNRRPSREQTRR